MPRSLQWPPAVVVTVMATLQLLVAWGLLPIAVATAAAVTTPTPKQEVGALCGAPHGILVEAMVFSGTTNPKFRLQVEERQRLCRLLRTAVGGSAAGSTRLRKRTCRVLGFTGWRVCVVPSTPSSSPMQLLAGTPCLELRAGPQSVEALLLRALRRVLPQAGAPLLAHIQSETRHLRRPEAWCKGTGEREPKHSHMGVTTVSMESQCIGPILGPDDPKKVQFSPETDDDGCFVKRQYQNNCYDYANDVVTNTFAQPGRGAGRCPPGTRPCVSNSCNAVRSAAEADGLAWVGQQLPEGLPEAGHYVSLHIWPGANFHWLRMDEDGTWSHKPGGSSVKDVDNRQRKIVDPSTADLAPWTEHCGYMLAVPSAVQLNSADPEAEETLLV